MMKQKIATLAVLSLSLSNWGCEEAKPSEQTAEASVPKAVASPAPVPSSSSDVYVATGPIVVENQVDLTAQREGMVASILVDVDKPVRQHDLLAQLDDRQATADRDAAAAKVRSIEADVKNWEAEVKVLEADQDRAEKEWQAQLITKEQLDHVRFKVVADRYELEREQQNLQNAQDQLRSRELELEKTRILAPFDGIVARRYIRVGQQVNPGDRLFWVTAVSPLRVKFTLPEKYIRTVRVGQAVVVTAAQIPGSDHEAKIIQISPVVDPASDTIEVLAQLSGAAGDLRPGMSANVRLENRQ